MDISQSLDLKDIQYLTFPSTFYSDYHRDVEFICEYAGNREIVSVRIVIFGSRVIEHGCLHRALEKLKGVKTTKEAVALYLQSILDHCEIDQYAVCVDEGDKGMIPYADVRIICGTNVNILREI